MTIVEQAGPVNVIVTSGRTSILEGSVRAADGGRILVLYGDLDPTRVSTFRAALTDALAVSDDVRADLSHVRSLDPPAIRELLRAQAVAARLDKSFAVIEVSPTVRQSLRAADAAGLLATPGTGQ
jgi:anti-anti-sigma regulatory factor